MNNNILLKKHNAFSYGKKLAYSLVRAFFLISVSYVVLYPIIYMLCKSFISTESATNPSIIWLPREISFDNYVNALKVLDYKNAFFVTIRIQMLSAIIETVSCSVTAYGLARFEFPGKNIVFAAVILTVIVPSQAIIVPLFLNFANIDVLGITSLVSKIVGRKLTLNILNTGWSFYLPALFAVGLKSGLFIFIYRQFFKSFPKELEEAASIDGAGPFLTFLKIVIPSSGIAYLCVFIFSIITYWNDYYLSVMFFKKDYPLAVSLKNISDAIAYYGLNHTTALARNITMTGCLLFIIPILLVYLLLQRKFIQSIDRIGIVG